LFSHVAGEPKDVCELRSLISKRRFYMKRFKPERFPVGIALIEPVPLASNAK
jgi:hypothetical protein